MKKQEKFLIGILCIAVVIFLVFLNNLKNSKNQEVVESMENIVETQEENLGQIKETKVSGYHLVTYNQSANTHSFIKSLEVEASNTAKIRFVIGSVDYDSMIEERTSFELDCKKGSNKFDLSDEKYILKESEYLFMDIYGQDTLYTQEGSTVEVLVQNEGRKLAGQMILEKEYFILPFKYTLEKIKDYNVLVIGNDITYIDNQNSYYNLTKARLEKTFDNLNIERINAKEWEINSTTQTRIEWIKENIKNDYIKGQDLVIFQLGDNYKSVNSLEENMKELVEYVRTGSPNAEMLWVGMWDIDKQILNKLPVICEKIGVEFVNISDLSTVDYQTFVNEKEITANSTDENSITSFTQRFQPNNEAMQIISNRIIEVLKFDF